MARKRSRRKKSRFPIELTGIILIFINILAIGRFGAVGILMGDILRLFVGETYLLISALLIGLGIYYVLNGSRPQLKRSSAWLGIILIYAAILLWMHSKAFDTLMDSDVNVIAATFRFFRNDLKTPEVTANLGGGLIGAILYSASYFLFGTIGTYIFIGILIFFGIMTIGKFSYKNLFHTIGKGLKKGGAHLKDGMSSYINQLRKKRKEHRDKGQKPEISQQNNESKISKKDSSELADQNPKVEISGPDRSLAHQDYNEQMALFEQEQTDQIISEDSNENEDKDDNDNISMNFEMDEPEESYELPSLSILKPTKTVDQSGEYKIIENNIKILEETFESFGVNARVVKANLGPAVTKYEIQLATGVKVSKIVGLSDDIALALAAKDIRMEAPIPGKALIGIEIPNSEIGMVHFRDMMANMPKESYHNVLEVPLGRDIGGNVATADLSKMPHLLIAGATGSGKSVAINSIITSILMKAKPHQVRLMLIDPKKVELSIYDGIPHLLTPVVTNPKKAARALHNVVAQMEERYELFAATGTRNVESYNEYLEQKREAGEDVPAKLPYIVVIVDELADLMMVASKEVENAIIRLAQMARAAGIHMILATQRPSVDVITGLIKANVPSRIAFAVSSGTDSRTILDQNGAEKLLGRGDMLFEPMGANKPSRIQGAYISDADVQAVTDYVRSQQDPSYVEEMIPKEESTIDPSEEKDEYFDEALDMLAELETISISLLQRRFRIGYNRAARLMDDLEAHGVVGPQEGPKPREVLLESLEESSSELSEDEKI